ncbi:4-hydroxyphenylpyruvate dioxygenase-like protein [Limulus polyphemus]|uniref:4-hydroxyphenylpyruvate dioxygenase-like protein n=1 Tax=Limulus polyphemus TaxID=6850 RepID=A0ABM1BJ67_LIMPO|nr:4-hydroxyphenylpyruvate dioxygenase-like protein [Limulus polyphemus]XP_013783057.1 4-hydroxyphenylpyruvate dioxygenase-like protein [Limulus polyphemus]XP_013783059.1 4-hydroxyphenylpyruvate dioxygenase-like protein [Limulus polyphemus]XP_013783060.1 4-hydroxyphenylpyruvate dioxygenase-like protein [Limulus polyphemus]XP_013783061.1 4-hydroxyphenylpyruvate dioxygenase-like protein [Limulus polyphemus]XP_022251122.1 4-hydroxyphenylpyruvate dioxygenase-like protein [Limulus polyphemus]XP_02
MTTVLHHVELCVKNGRKVLGNFIQNFGFRLHARRTTEFVEQKVVRSGQSVFVINEILQKGELNFRENKRIDDDWTILCCHETDTVFNVALHVKDVGKTTERARAIGAHVVREPCDVQDRWGHVTYSIVKSCCGNVLHTLINKDNYLGPFLPGFEMMEDSAEQNSSGVTHVDHVTYVCRPGESHSILNWYEQVFGMKRFLMNREENMKEGLILDGQVGMRLKAMEYWRCAEVGLSSAPSTQPENPGANSGQSLIFVLAESLFGQENSHVETFLHEHGSPGVQHIGLTTSNMLETVAYMANKGVMFRKPPGAYYRQPDKIQQIHAVGQDLKVLQHLGILLDSEADPAVETRYASGHRYLMQIFTLPLFDRETFFLEVLQRHGARGFGAGNVMALARSVEEEKSKMLTDKQNI